MEITQNKLAVNLSLYRKGNYNPGGVVKCIIWYCVNHLIFCSPIPFPSAMKRVLLMLFGCRIEKCIIKPRVNIKYPWFLTIGKNVWIGEDAWIDNLALVEIGDNVCISQSALLLTGNHDYSTMSFDLIVKPITIENGVWIGAKAVVCPGSVLRSHSVLSAGTVFSGESESYTIYKGNPATAIRKRIIVNNT